MTTTTRTFKKGDTVYRNVTDPNRWGFGVPYTVERTRKASDRQYDQSAHVWLKGDKYGVRAYQLTHADDLTPEQRAAVAEEQAKRSRAEAEERDSKARLEARNAATREANRDKLDAPPVYGPVIVGDGRWQSVTEDRKPVGSTFTYWTTTKDKHGVLSVVPRTDWVGVTVERKNEGGWGEASRWVWGISMSGTTYNPTHARIIAEAIRMALDEVIPTLGDSRPVYDRD